MQKKLTYKAVTLTELMLILAIGVLISGTMIFVFSQIARISKSTSMQLLMATKTHHITELLEREIRRACHVTVSDDGTSLKLTFAEDSNNDGQYEFTDVYYRYQNPDGNHLTISDNVLVQDNDETPNNGNEKTLLRYVTPIRKSDDNYEKIFTQDSLKGPVVYIKFRVGDTTKMSNNSQNAVTGPGYQGIQIITKAIPRNTQLYRQFS